MRHQLWIYSSLAGMFLASLGIHLYKPSRLIPAPFTPSSLELLPPAIRKCWSSPQNGVVRAKVSAGGMDYYAIGSYWTEGYRQFLIAVDSQAQCHSLLPDDRRLPDNFLSAYVSEALARQVMLQFYLNQIEQMGSQKAFEQQFLAKSQTLKTQKAYLSPEQGWALEQLKVPIPKNMQVISAADYLKLL